MNKDAGRTQPIFVTVRLENGEELPFVLDTGTQGTVFDQSLEPKLGKRLRTESLSSWGVKQEAGIYVAPKLYLGGTLLRNTGTNVSTGDLKSVSSALGRPVMGFLCMDVLENYCIQLDFAAHRIRFLNDERVSKKDWGKPFPLTEGCFFISENLVGGEASNSLSLIDTGYNGDGWLTPSLFQQWTNQAILPAAGQARSPNGWLGGESYPDLNLQRCEDPYNGIGLYVLSRHLVILDFPKRKMYLKRTSVGSLHLDIKEVKAEAKSAAVVLKSLKNKGRLPGWTKDDEAATEKERYIPRSTVSGCFVVQKKNGDLSVYHFQVIRASENQAWKLQRAWRTDENGRTLEEYPIP